MPCPELPLSSDVPDASSTATAPPDTPSPFVTDEAPTDLLFAVGAEFDEDRLRFPLEIDLLEVTERSLPNIFSVLNYNSIK